MSPYNRCGVRATKRSLLPGTSFETSPSAEKSLRPATDSVPASTLFGSSTSVPPPSTYAGDISIIQELTHIGLGSNFHNSLSSNTTLTWNSATIFTADKTANGSGQYSERVANDVAMTRTFGNKALFKMNTQQKAKDKMAEINADPNADQIIPVKWELDVSKVPREILSNNIVRRRAKSNPSKPVKESYILVYCPVSALKNHFAQSEGGVGGEPTRLETVLKSGVPGIRDLGRGVRSALQFQPEVKGEIIKKMAMEAAAQYQSYEPATVPGSGSKKRSRTAKELAEAEQVALESLLSIWTKASSTMANIVPEA